MTQRGRPAADCRADPLESALASVRLAEERDTGTLAANRDRKDFATLS